MERAERAKRWAKQNARKERIECVECGTWYTGNPKEPHVCGNCTEEMINATVTQEFATRELAEAYLAECEDKLLTCHLSQAGSKWVVKIEK